MLPQLTPRTWIFCSALIGGIVLSSYPFWSDLAANSERLKNDKSRAYAAEDYNPPTVSPLPSKHFYPQSSSVAIAINQKGTLQRADARGYINVGIGETYKIEIYSPNYASAVSVKIDGVSIIDKLICDRSVTLERPIAVAKQFIVLEEGNPGLDREGGVNNPNLGLIEVTFVPIKRRAIALETLPRKSDSNAASAPSTEALRPGNATNRGTPVGTGLSGNSDQEFIATNDWVEAPEIAATYTKKYRLVGFRSEPVTLHNMTQSKPPVIDSTPPRL